jgi:sugar phosphate permease
VCPNTPAVQWASIAAVGFGLYGPQMLIGLCGAEVCNWLPQLNRELF